MLQRFFKKKFLFDYYSSRFGFDFNSRNYWDYLAEELNGTEDGTETETEQEIEADFFFSSPHHIHTQHEINISTYTYWAIRCDFNEKKIKREIDCKPAENTKSNPALKMLANSSETRKHQ